MREQKIKKKNQSKIIKVGKGRQRTTNYKFGGTIVHKKGWRGTINK